MLNKELIELQKGCKATCVVILDEDSKELDSKITISSKSNDHELLTNIKEMINEEQYFIVTGIDELDENSQEKYYQIVKDREFYGYKLPDDTIIVLAVKEKEGLKRIKQELYQLCVVAF